MKRAIVLVLALILALLTVVALVACAEQARAQLRPTTLVQSEPRVQLAPLAGEEDVTIELYFVPILSMRRGEDPGHHRRPKYWFTNVENPPDSGNWEIQRGPLESRGINVMDYGFFNLMEFGLVLGRDMTITDVAYMEARSVQSGTVPVEERDVYLLDLDNLDVNISNASATKDYFEAVNLPTDWLTAANTYRQLLRSLASMFLFSQRYQGISANTPWDINQGVVTYTVDSLTDSGQDFTDWQTLTAPAAYRVAMEYERTEGTGIAAGYLATATGGTTVDVYRGIELTVPGWNGMASDAGAAIAYAVAYAEGHVLFQEVTMDTKYNAFPPEVQQVFSATVAYFYGDDPSDLIKPNYNMRQMLKAASDFYTKPFSLGPITF